MFEKEKMLTFFVFEQIQNFRPIVRWRQLKNIIIYCLPSFGRLHISKLASDVLPMFIKVTRWRVVGGLRLSSLDLIVHIVHAAFTIIVFTYYCLMASANSRSSTIQRRRR